AMAREMPDAGVALVALRSTTSGESRIGDLFDRAVAQQAEPGHIVVDDHVANLLDARFRLRHGATHVMVLLGEDEVAERPRLLLGRPTPFVGRERELGALRATLDDVKTEGLARAVLITAGPGVGKSRLRQELVTSQSGFEVWTARADAMSAGSPSR